MSTPLTSLDGSEIFQWQELALSTPAGGAVIPIAPLLAAAATLTWDPVAQLATFTSATALPASVKNREWGMIFGAADAGFNGYVNLTLTGPNSFTYAPVAASPPAVTTDAGGAGVYKLKVRRAIVQVAAANTGTLSLGPNSNATARTLAVVGGFGQEWNFPALPDTGGAGGTDGQAPGRMGNMKSCFDLGAWCYKGSAAGQTASLLYLV